MEVIADYDSLPLEIKRQFLTSPALTLLNIDGVVMVIPVALPVGLEKTMSELEAQAKQGLNDAN